jgi:hypothetical protein
MVDWERAFSEGLPYEGFLEKHGSAKDRDRWAAVFPQLQLNAAQRSLLSGFVREMNVLCLAGTWCGDCVGQCPLLEHFARASSGIRLRFLDRDAHPDVAGELRVCGGARVPVVVFLSEDFAECGRYGDRTLSRYRAMARELSGAACSTGVATPDSLGQVADDWLREFERVQLMLRVSPRLRQKHGD